MPAPMCARETSAMDPLSAAPAAPADDALAALRALESQLLQAVEANPLEAMALLVGSGAGLLYLAEAGRNEKIETYWDALHYVATSLSVGYANIFPETAFGKALGALLMMVGPALSSRALNPPSPAPTGAPESELLAEKLDAILAELKRIGGPR